MTSAPTPPRRAPRDTGPDSLTLNGAPQSLDTPRSQACLGALRRSARRSRPPTRPCPSCPPSAAHRLAQQLPTAAGLASSAAGFAALVRAVADLYALPADPGALSVIARQGQRLGLPVAVGRLRRLGRGHARGRRGQPAVQVAEAAHWSDVRALILVASGARKSRAVDGGHAGDGGDVAAVRRARGRGGAARHGGHGPGRRAAGL